MLPGSLMYTEGPLCARYHGDGCYAWVTDARYGCMTVKRRGGTFMPPHPVSLPSNLAFTVSCIDRRAPKSCVGSQEEGRVTRRGLGVDRGAG